MFPHHADSGSSSQNSGPAPQRLQRIGYELLGSPETGLSASTSDDRLLNTKWRMLSAGKLMNEQTRYEAVRGRREAVSEEQRGAMLKSLLHDNTSATGYILR